MTNESENMNRLRWCCRRGMLELDILLSPFLDKGYSQLSEQQRADFKRFLDCTDPELFAWLMGHESPPTEEFVELVRRIKASH